MSVDNLQFEVFQITMQKVNEQAKLLKSFTKLSISASTIHILFLVVNQYSFLNRLANCLHNITPWSTEHEQVLRDKINDMVQIVESHEDGHDE